MKRQYETVCMKRKLPLLYINVYKLNACGFDSLSSHLKNLNCNNKTIRIENKDLKFQSPVTHV